MLVGTLTFVNLLVNFSFALCFSLSTLALFELLLLHGFSFRVLCLLTANLALGFSKAKLRLRSLMIHEQVLKFLLKLHLLDLECCLAVLISI